jgi:integrase
MAPKKKLPLYLHANGQWCKRINGRIYYFGTDQAEALLSYAKSKESIAAGRGKVVLTGTMALHRLADVYYDHKKQQVQLGVFSERSLGDIKKTLMRLSGIIGRTSNPEGWGQRQFDMIKSGFMQAVPRKKNTGGRASTGTRSHVTVNGDIRRIRAFLNWLNQTKRLENDQHRLFLTEAPARVTMIERQKSSAGPMTAGDIKLVIAQSNRFFLPVLMLGINGGMGAADIAQITLPQLTEMPWLDCPRAKTGASRRIWLWPETVQAIESRIKERKEPYRSAWGDIAFLTLHRTPWVRDGQDSATQAFRQNRIAAGLKRGSFYDLRRTFQTIGDETLDFPAVSFCMGHTPRQSDMSARYRTISDERVKSVCSKVREWLFGVK